MPRYAKLLLTTVITTAILVIAISSAPANRLSVNLTTFRASWTSLGLGGASITMSCPVTFEGSFHGSTIAKTVGALIGYVTRASVRGGSAAGECTGGTTTIRQESLPWHIRYRGYSGILPSITLLVFGLIGGRFRVQPTGNIACNTATEPTHPAISRITVIREAGGALVAESMTAEPNVRIPLEDGFCAFGGEAHFEGSSQALTQLGTTARIAIRLI